MRIATARVAKILAEDLPPVLDYVEGVVPDAGGAIFGAFTIADAGLSPISGPWANRVCRLTPRAGRRPRPTMTRTLTGRRSWCHCKIYSGWHRPPG